ncbi:MAG: potassium-transporting ATPase subunit KdpC [Legionellales bacterium]|nr:potassium-transporting ATPase subunit KdpC [Legionellales bacterium]
MFKTLFSQVKSAGLILVFLSIVTGLIYPLTITMIAELSFPWQANGSLVESQGSIIASVLIGQSMISPRYFWGRPSETMPFPYNSESSSGSNSGPSNEAYLARVGARVNDLKKWDFSSNKAIPVDLVTASGSGLDPDISPQAAYYQVSRIAKARQLSEEDVTSLVDEHIQKRTFGILGEPRINVLSLNLALDNL